MKVGQRRCIEKRRLKLRLRSLVMRRSRILRFSTQSTILSTTLSTLPTPPPNHQHRSQHAKHVKSATQYESRRYEIACSRSMGQFPFLKTIIDYGQN